MRKSIHFEGGSNPALEIDTELEKAEIKKGQKNISELVSLISMEIPKEKTDEAEGWIISVLKYDRAEEFAQKLLKLEGEEIDNAKVILNKVFPDGSILAFENLDLEMRKELNEKFGLKLSEK
jgi:hypothetical protein